MNILDEKNELDKHNEFNRNNELDKRNEKATAEKKLRVVKSPQRSLSEAQVWIDFGDFNLLLPSHEIVSLLSAKNVEAAITHKETSAPKIEHRTDIAADCGFIEFEYQKLPVFCFNKALQLQSMLLNSHAAIIVLEHQELRFAISATEISKVNEASLNIHKVPMCMSSRKQPFTEFTIVNNRAAGITSAAALMKLLRLRGVKNFASQDQTLSSYFQGTHS